MNRSPIVLILMVSVVVSVGCAKPDWIQSTLVTVDVTGTWRSANGDFVLSLKQEGPKVTGYMRRTGMGGILSVIEGDIQGAVTGDVFSWKQTAGTLTSCVSDMSVSEDEIAGVVHCHNASKRLVQLRRVDASR